MSTSACPTRQVSSYSGLNDLVDLFISSSSLKNKSMRSNTLDLNNLHAMRICLVNFSRIKNRVFLSIQGKYVVLHWILFVNSMVSDTTAYLAFDSRIIVCHMYSWECKQ
jgi:hypothetical protein